MQSRGNKWGFPKGGFELGETAVKCAEREVHEETSFNVRFIDDDLKVKYKDTTFFVKHLQNKPPSFDELYLKTPGNDCTGIGWVRLTCLRKLVRRETKYDLPYQFNTLTLTGSSSTPMQFNLGVRKFVKEYIPK